MKRPRPHIPLSVRIVVIERQAGVSDQWRRWARAPDMPGSSSAYLSFMLKQVFKELPTHLDHDPPLRARAFNPRTGKYKPDANDPRYLIYRSQEDHRVKTYVRGEHGQYSDTILIARERKREKKKAGKLPTYRWPKRKMRSRPNAAFRANNR